MGEVPGKSIFIEQLEGMFSNISENIEWNMSGPMLWGYFFTNQEPAKLEKVGQILVSRGYNFVDIYLSDKDSESDPDVFWLHMERVEVHTPKSLDERNNELYIFAHEHGLASYDGMDVGPVSN